MKTGLAILCALLAGCSSDPSTGTGSQTGNSIVAGRILKTDSTQTGTTMPVAGISVCLRPLEWISGSAADPSSLQTTVTDTAGNYRFPNPPPSTYRIEARDTGRGWSRTVKVVGQDTTLVPDGTVQKWGRLFVEVEWNDTVRGGELYFYGLDRSVQLPDTGTKEWKHMVDSLPVGLQTIRLWSTKTNSVIVNLPVRIGPDSTSKIEYEHGKMGVEGPEEDDR
jgi:hypothetical protein